MVGGSDLVKQREQLGMFGLSVCWLGLGHSLVWRVLGIQGGLVFGRLVSVSDGGLTSLCLLPSPTACVRSFW